MLQSLHIVNFAIIEDSWIDFEKGVTVFTGETGSGKSILMDALAILLGRRASVELIRNGKEFFRVEGVFTAEPEILPALEEMGIEAENGEILISRKMNKNGRGICTVNSALCTVKQLEKLGRRLVKIHEQNENENLLSADFCRYLVDHFSEQLTEAFREYEAAFSEWKTVQKKFTDFQNSKQEHERRLDILQWEIEQIERAQVRDADEGSAVREKLLILENHEKIYREAGRAVELLSGESGAQSGLAEAVRRIGSIVRYDPALSGVEQNLQNALYALEDASSELENYLGGEEFSEEELAELQARDELLTQLKNKYGPSLEDVLSYLAKAKKEYDSLYAMVYDSETMQEQFRRLTEEVMEKSRALNAVRREQGALLCQKITEGLRDMNMEHARMELYLKEPDIPTASGVQEMEFYFSANPGEPLRPMRQTASGGEISRIALAIEDVMAHLFACQTLVFDEIDTGISGGTALNVARKIRHLSETVQVICITHMPQTAGAADQHYSIRKTVRDEKTSTAARRLTGEEHIQDIAWMISGNRPPNESAVQSAREILEAVCGKR